MPPVRKTNMPFALKKKKTLKGEKKKCCHGKMGDVGGGQKDALLQELRLSDIPAPCFEFECHLETH